MSLTKDDLKILSAPFPDHVLGVKVQATSKAKNKAMLVIYVSHTDVAARLEEVDPSWESSITGEQIIGEFYVTRMRLTVKGVTREGVGEGTDPKSAASDALKRAATLFSVGRYLYDSDQVWVDYNEANDKYRVFTIEEYNRAKPKAAVKPSAPAIGPKPTVSSSPTVKPAVRTKQAIWTEIVRVSGEMGMGTEQRTEWVLEEFKKPAASMTVEELLKFEAMILNEAGRNGVAI